MDPNSLTQSAVTIANEAADLAAKAAALAQQSTLVAAPAAGGGADILTLSLTVFVLACFVGYYVVWRVTPALHSPLMAVTNAISSVIIVGALLAAGASAIKFSETMGLLAVGLASVNIFGGFVVTQRMLGKFKKKGAK
jgi:NAD(P) transhydrogenase subunit alpha